MSIDDKTGKNDDDYDINDFFWSCCQSLRRDVLYLRRDFSDDEDDDHELSMTMMIKMMVMVENV